MHWHRRLSPALRIAAAALIGASSGTQLLPAQTKLRCTPYPVVDLRSASVAGLALDTTIAFIRAAIGSANIRRYMVDAEGGRVPVYSLRICGHAIEWNEDGVSWSDSVYRSPEGLGVGSTLGAFDSTFGMGKISADHGLQVRYELERHNLYVEVGDCFTLGPPITTVDRRCRVLGIFLEPPYPH